MRFVDTNVLLYAVSTVEHERRKATIARRLLRERNLAMSIQVLQEFYVQATRPSKANRLTHDQAVGLIESFERYPTQEITTSILHAALRTKERFQISYWDAAVIEAARERGCDVVLSEDMNDGQDYEGVVVQNPFV